MEFDQSPLAQHILSELAAYIEESRRIEAERQAEALAAIQSEEEQKREWAEQERRVSVINAEIDKRTEAYYIVSELVTNRLISTDRSDKHLGGNFYRIDEDYDLQPPTTGEYANTHVALRVNGQYKRTNTFLEIEWPLKLVLAIAEEPKDDQPAAVHSIPIAVISEPVIKSKDGIPQSYGLTKPGHIEETFTYEVGGPLQDELAVLDRDWVLGILREAEQIENAN